MADGQHWRKTSRSGPDPQYPYASLCEEERRPQRSVWDRIAGLSVIIVVSAGGWTAVIALLRLLR